MPETYVVKLRDVEFSELNVLLLDLAKFCWNDDPWEGQVLSIDKTIRNREIGSLKKLINNYKRRESKDKESKVGAAIILQKNKTAQ